MLIYVPISVGELIDKAVILEIKIERIKDAEKRKNCLHEYELLQKIIKEHGYHFSEERALLKKINEEEWVLLDLLRAKEASKCFDEEFIEAARHESYTNDKRAKLKRVINQKSGSIIIEEKQYVEYHNP